MSGNSFEAAQELEAAGNLEAAVLEYGRLIEVGFAVTDALVHRSALLRELGRLAEAEADLSRAAAISPHNPWPLMRLGQLAGASGRNGMEAFYKQAALDLEPHNFELRVNATAAYTQLDWLDLAYAIARTLPEGLPDWWAGARQNALQRYLACRAETLALLRTRRIAADRILFLWDLCQRLFRLGRLRMARRLCEALMREIPTSFPAFFFCSRIISRQSGSAEAAAFLRSIAWLHRESSEYSEALVRQLHELGRYDEVLLEANTNVAEQDPEEIRYIKCVALLMLSRVDELRHYCRDWLRHSPRSVPPAGFVTAAHLMAGGGPVAAGARAPASVHLPQIVQFWDACDVPSDVAATMQSWVQNYPDFEHRLFNEMEVRSFLIARFGSRGIETFDMCHHIAMKADYFRLAYLLDEGGIWADADERSLQRLDSLLHAAAQSVLTAPLSGDTPGYLHNFFLGARSGSAIIRYAFEDAEQQIRRDLAEGRRPDIWQVTGPGLITRAAAAYLTDKVEIVPSEVIMVPLHQYRALARTDGNLAYKRKQDKNWQLA